MDKSNIETNTAGVKFEVVKDKLMKDINFRIAYDELAPRYEVISQIIEARKSLKMTQEELAIKSGTRKSNISRLESGSYNPSINFLVKIAKGLGKDLHIEIK